MKLWKRTVLLMLVTLLCALIPVGTLSLYITGKRSLNNAAETYGRQLENGKILLEQFWDNSKYEQMSETGKQAYMGFQFQRCCGEGMALIDRKSNAVIENLTDYKVVGLENLGFKDEGDPYAYKIQKLGQKYLLLQLEPLSRPEGYEVLSVREVTGLFAELRQTAVWFFGIYLAVFLIAGLFIYMMMRRTVEQMEKLQEVAEKQELLMGALSHEMRTPLTSIIGYSDTLRHVKLKDEQKDRALEHINREGKRLEALSGKMLQMLGLYQNHAIQMEMTMAGDLLNHVIDMEKEQAEKKAVHLKMECEAFSMKMDPALMESLLINLIDNALKATEEERKALLQEIAQIEEASLSEMMVWSDKQDASGIVKELFRQLEDLDKEEALCYFASFIPIPERERVKNQVLNRTGILHTIFPAAILGKGGKLIAKSGPVKKPDGTIDEGALKDNMERTATMEMDYFAQILVSNTFEYIRSKFLIEESDIKKIVDVSCAIPEGRKESYTKGLMFGFSGDFLTALSILIPQIENAVRYLAVECGEPVYNMNEEGIEEIKSMHAVLELEGVKESLDEDLIFALNTIFCSKFGFNMRNNVAHGMLDDQAFQSFKALYIWWFALKFCYLFCGKLKEENRSKINKKLKQLMEKKDNMDEN